MAVYGADVDELRGAATEFERAADRLDHVSTALGGELARAPWEGADAERFRSNWSTDHSRRIADASTRLRDAARALMAGEVDAACMIDGNHLLFGKEGTLPAGGTRILAQTDPYDHCTMAVAEHAPAEPAARFVTLLLSMSYSDPEVRPLLDLEGLTEWREGRASRFGQLDAAVRSCAFYDDDGAVTASDYQP
ncbi:MAG: PhnD/SsuA/transferrin family substrate-binding protein [Microbacterium sp.]|nr:PhnD/SsuA/transferrin family substrate-binding protein [Microbacterium sp.]